SRSGSIVIEDIVPFQFTIAFSGTEVRLDQSKGTAWKFVTGRCGALPCEWVVDESGIGSN
ncbi:MAG: hypothetical protein R3330_07125, partial [Saprospiraceae bacterium]|nr:hypothetical protein [Saprospiraceae bacterium]